MHKFKQTLHKLRKAELKEWRNFDRHEYRNIDAVQPDYPTPVGRATSFSDIDAVQPDY